jgi:hypothetical protein
MDFQQTAQMMRGVMKILFEEDWRQLDDIPEVAETQWKSIRVVLGVYELVDQPVLSIKCGLLKQMPQHPDLSRHVHSMNPKMFFGRLQLHWGADDTNAITCEHFMGTDCMPMFDAPSVQTVINTVQYMVERSEHLQGKLRAEFGGRPFEDELDGLTVVACG